VLFPISLARKAENTSALFFTHLCFVPGTAATPLARADSVFLPSQSGVLNVRPKAAGMRLTVSNRVRFVGCLAASPLPKAKRRMQMFIELHMLTDNSPVVIGVRHITKIEASVKEGTYLHLNDQVVQSILVRENYNEVKHHLASPDY
jgi:hypothetical protein